MPVLRDLITRFSFDVNEKDIHKYDKTVGSMTKKALKLGAVFAGAFTAKGLFDAGKTTAQTAENLKAVADTEFNNLQKGLSQVKQSLEETRKGASVILTDRTFNILATDFINTFGTGKKELKSFMVLLEASSKLALRMSKPLEDVFAGFKNSVVTGDLSVLENISGVNRTETQSLENILSLINPNEIGGEAGRSQKLNAVSNFLKKAQPTQDKSLSKLDDSVFSATKARLRKQQLEQKAGEKVYKVTSPITEGIDKGLIKAIDAVEKMSLFGNTDKEGRTDAGKSWDSLGSDLKGWFSGLVKDHNKEYGNTKESTSKIEVKANISVVSPDPINAGKEVKKQIENIIMDASRQKIKTEDNRP